MPARRYTIVVADRTTGAVRRITISARPVIAAVCAVASLPVLIGVGAAWKARADVSALYASHEALEAENASYRSATESLAGEIDALQGAIKELGAKSALDPSLAKAMDRLPALVKARAMGGGGTTAPRNVGNADDYTSTLSALATPEDTFGLLRNLLGGLQSRLLDVKKSVDRRNALATATPSLWPINGWITSTMGYRQDPITGDSDFHPGLDIAGDRGEPVHVDGRRHGQAKPVTRMATATSSPLTTVSACRRDTATCSAIRSSLATPSSAATSSAASVPPVAQPGTTCTTRCSPTGGSSIRSNSSPSKDPATSNARRPVCPRRMRIPT